MKGRKASALGALPFAKHAIATYAEKLKRSPNRQAKLNQPREIASDALKNIIATT